MTAFSDTYHLKGFSTLIKEHDSKKIQYYILISYSQETITFLKLPEKCSLRDYYTIKYLCNFTLHKIGQHTI